MATYSGEELYYKLDNMVLSCCPQLREIFKIRWKEQTKSDWGEDKSHKDKLIEGLIPQKSTKCPLKTFQQISVKEKPMSKWDISLLSDILLLQSTISETSLQENVAIRQLKNIRNLLAHNDIGNNVNEEDGNTSRNCTEDEYEKISGMIRDSLVSLGMNNEEIDKLIELSGVTSSLKALERVKTLYTDAEILIKYNRFDEAIQIYSDALDTPSMLPEHRGEAFEKRAECYLKYSSKTGQDFLDQVHCDVMKALELNRSSWFANYLAAQCYRKKYDLRNAIHYFKLAHVSNPTSKLVKRDMTCCKILAGIHPSDECMSPLLILTNLDKQFANLEKETGIKIEDGKLKPFFTEIGKRFPGQDHVLRGHMHFAGWNVPQNFTEAIQHYAKAERISNLEGTFSLGKCYHFGCGADQDVKKALKIYQTVAYMDRYYVGRLTASKCNIGVAYSQYSIGTMYAEGVGVCQNFKEATGWYKKAMDNGVGFAANALGNLYINGLGVPLDEEMAELCWIKAVDLEDANAAASLVAYYIRKNIPDKASNMMNIGRLLGNEYLMNIQDDELSAVVNQMIK